MSVFAFRVSLSADVDFHALLQPLLLVLILTLLAIYGYQRTGLPLLLSASVLSLLTIGLSIQLTLSNGADSLWLVLVHLLAIAIGVGVVALWRKCYPWLTTHLPCLAVILGMGLLLLSLLLLCAPATNATKAWIYVFGISIQLTEGIKLLYILFLAALFATVYPPLVQFSVAGGSVVLLALFAVSINELGTLLVLVCIYGILCFLTLPLRYTGVNIMLGFLAVFLIVVFFGSLEAYLTDHEPVLAVVEQLAVIMHKLEQRILIVTDLASLDAYGLGYQAIQSQSALLLAGLLGGSQYSIYIPAGKTDLVLVSLAQSYGWLCVITVFALYCLLLVQGGKVAMGQSSKFTVCILMGVLVNLFVQVLFPFLGGIGLFPLTGVATPFLSRSGSQTVTTMVQIAFLCSCTIPQYVPKKGVRTWTGSQSAENCAHTGTSLLALNTHNNLFQPNR
ncbi:FtsW/RodA/SpoVE family cell cycle protein [Bengtsoniella intestinalis]|uniref:FtsW/RodA/SpoVE family cell cycle protein n=1 Tax=Bengtsoniella intestinalis TaxID=3073143 RepID=UPI00391F6CEF